jgi:hypothetical protein
MNARERTLARLANAARRPACVDDQRVNHGAFLEVCWLTAFAAGHGAKSIRSGSPAAHVALRFPVVASAMLSHSHP